MINTEIARLNAEIDRLIEANQAPDGFSWEWHCNRKDEEIERLRAEADQNQWRKDWHILAAENERLREEITKKEELLQLNREWAEKILNRDDEIERLRGTLQWLDRWIGEKPLLECANKIREALGE